MSKTAKNKRHEEVLFIFILLCCIAICGCSVDVDPLVYMFGHSHKCYKCSSYPEIKMIKFENPPQCLRAYSIHYEIECKKCGMKIESENCGIESAKQLVEAWNRRNMSESFD